MTSNFYRTLTINRTYSVGNFSCLGLEFFISLRTFYVSYAHTHTHTYMHPDIFPKFNFSGFSNILTTLSLKSLKKQKYFEKYIEHVKQSFN